MSRTPEEEAKHLELIARIKNQMKAHIKLRGLTYADMAHRLKEYGQDENEASIANKISRGTFSAEFMMACFLAMDMKDVDLRYLHEGE